MNKKEKLGKVLGQFNGYTLRIMLESKTHETEGRDGKAIRTTSLGDSGKIGVYAGTKKLVKGDFKSKEEAIEYTVSLKSGKK